MKEKHTEIWSFRFKCNFKTPIFTRS